MNTLRNLIHASLVSCMILLPSVTSAETFTVDDFRFSFDPTFSDWGSTAGAVPVGSSPYGTIVEGTYQGTTTTNVITNFDFFGGPVYVYTSDTNLASSEPGAGSTPAGVIPGGPTPTIDTTNLTADLSSWFATWNGTGFHQGTGSDGAPCSGSTTIDSFNPTAIVTDNGNNRYTVSWSSCIGAPAGSSFYGQIGYWRLELTCITCVPSNLQPEDVLSVTQATMNTLTVGKPDGDVTITSARPINGNTTYTWTASDASITDTDGNAANEIFVFDPSAVPVGTYKISHSYLDTTNFPASTDNGKGAVLIRVKDGSLIEDTDLDGIPNPQDDGGLTAQQLQSVYGNSSGYVLQSSSGSLKVGTTAFCAAKGARISQQDIIDMGGSACTSVTNASDDLIKRIGVGGFFDFEVNGLTVGETVNVVIPLTEAIPTNATYRKYDSVNGWALFELDDGEVYASAPSTSDGICPAPGSSAYVHGLHAGDNCVQLTLTDGGINDADNAANGSIKDPGGIAQIESGVDATLRGNGCSMTANANARDHAEWLLVAGFIALLGWFKLSRRKA